MVTKQPLRIILVYPGLVPHATKMGDDLYPSYMRCIANAAELNISSADICGGVGTCVGVTDAAKKAHVPGQALYGLHCECPYLVDAASNCTKTIFNWSPEAGMTVAIVRLHVLTPDLARFHFFVQSPQSPIMNSHKSFLFICRRSISGDVTLASRQPILLYNVFFSSPCPHRFLCLLDCSPAQEPFLFL